MNNNDKQMAVEIADNYNHNNRKKQNNISSNNNIKNNNNNIFGNKDYDRITGIMTNIMIAPMIT